MSSELFMLCNEQGQKTGTATWLEAHTFPGKLHRAFSVYVFNENGSKILTQKRSALKPLWPLFLANTCCSHPRDGEEVMEIAPRRLHEECGFSCPLDIAGSYVYQAVDPGRGVEHEHVTILRGCTEKMELPVWNPSEIEELRWTTITRLLDDFSKHPEQYAPWFPLGLSLLLQ